MIQRVSSFDQAEFAAEIQALAGLPCGSCIAGRGTGSHVALDFGERIRRAEPIRNERLTMEQRSYIGEKRLFITCVWRLDSADQVVCGAWDSNEDDGLMIEGLDQIVGKNLIAVRASPPAWDLTLDFGHRTLSVFCDQVDEENDDDNYTLFVPQRVLTIGARSRLRIERLQYGLS